MNEPYRKRVYDALLGPIDSVPHGARHAREILEDLAADDLKNIEPIIDDMVFDMVAALEVTARNLRGMIRALPDNAAPIARDTLVSWLAQVDAAIGSGGQSFRM